MSNTISNKYELIAVILSIIGIVILSFPQYCFNDSTSDLTNDATNSSPSVRNFCNIEYTNNIYSGNVCDDDIYNACNTDIYLESEIRYIDQLHSDPEEFEDYDEFEMYMFYEKYHEDRFRAISDNGNYRFAN